jgi:hypothetical protein
MTHKSLGLLTAAVVLVACAPPKPAAAPAPQATRTTRPVSEVVAIAAKTLTADGFEVTVNDATAGLLTAKRQQTNRDGTVCSWPRNSRAESSASTRIIVVNVTARADSGQTAVQVSSRVRVSIPSLSLDNETDCASDGAIENKLLDALIPVRRR